MGNTTRWGVRALGLLVGLSLVAAACGDSSSGSSSGGSSKTGKIALLLPESQTARYETQDRPNFEAKLKSLCAKCEILYSNADQDAAKQQTQAEAALTNGAKVMVLDPVDGTAAAAIATTAKAKSVPVISYDRLIKNSDIDVYISFDNEKVGRLQGQALVDKLKKDGKSSGDLVMINGSPTDNNASLFKKGAHSVIDTSGFKVAAESDTVEWKADNAQKDMDGHITKVGKDKIVGVYAANDGTAGGAIAAMKNAGIKPLPPVTGQDAEVAGIQRILAGDQFMTVYKAIKPQAEGAAQAAIDLLNGKKPANATAKVNNGKIDVPSILLDPVAVTKDNVKDTVIKDGFWKATDICTAAFADACKAASIA
ncbi:MAG: sugar ABC transporter substrate-binding protein [Actinobacteria bacterium]|nr:MAG: sugar ABC transporter substrate-binding protein [Actinomycetota bacterium]